MIVLHFTAGVQRGEGSAPAEQVYWNTQGLTAFQELPKCIGDFPQGRTHQMMILGLEFVAANKLLFNNGNDPRTYRSWASGGGPQKRGVFYFSRAGGCLLTDQELIDKWDAFCRDNWVKGPSGWESMLDFEDNNGLLPSSQYNQTQYRQITQRLKRLRKNLFNFNL